ncbi:hypothetical protein PPS11_04395 [Pseudomonas putida S11]|nr:hypothetical protein PPS11_04395 [Pseudomonas putida S11]
MSSAKATRWAPPTDIGAAQKIGRRFRLFFRYDSRSKVIVYAWVNDENTLRSAGSKSDPYAVFEKMPGRGNPPDDWDALTAATRSDWDEPKA